MKYRENQGHIGTQIHTIMMENQNVNINYSKFGNLPIVREILA